MESGPLVVVVMPVLAMLSLATYGSWLLLVIWAFVAALGLVAGSVENGQRD